MPNRYLCDVFEGMRQAFKTRNFSYLLALVEEGQYIGERMEAGLADIRDLARLTSAVSEEKQKLEDLEKSVKENEELAEILESQIEELRDKQLAETLEEHKKHVAMLDKEQSDWKDSLK